MKIKKSHLEILLLLAIPVLIYTQFLGVKIYSIYGDDLYGFREISKPHSFLETISLSTSVAKYRPISDIIATLLYKVFYKNLIGYYVFNVIIQTLNTYLVAFILNLFLKSFSRSLLYALIYGLSRFSFYTCSQIFCGGNLEGLAMSFFLAALFFLLKPLINKELPEKTYFNNILWSVILANLSVYTHERYVVLFPFIILVVLFFPKFNKITLKQKLLLSSIALASILLNIIVKKYIYSIPFFVGTGGANISLNLSLAAHLLKNAILCIFQINLGDLGHSGSLFDYLSFTEKFFISILTIALLFLFFRYVYKSVLFYKKIEEIEKTQLFIFMALFVLFWFCIAPAIITIRLEQRWLQASFSVFLIMAIIAFDNISFKNYKTKNSLTILFVLYFLGVNANYLYKGLSNFYTNNSQKWAAIFEAAIKKEVIKPNTNTLYIWMQQKNTDGLEDFIRWSVAEGYLFEYYQTKSKKIEFAGPSYIQSANSPRHFSKDSAQIIYVRENVIEDITDEFLVDSLKNFRY